MTRAMCLLVIGLIYNFVKEAWSSNNGMCIIGKSARIQADDTKVFRCENWCNANLSVILWEVLLLCYSPFLYDGRVAVLYRWTASLVFSLNQTISLERQVNLIITRYFSHSKGVFHRHTWLSCVYVALLRKSITQSGFQTAAERGVKFPTYPFFCFASLLYQSKCTTLNN